MEKKKKFGKKWLFVLGALILIAIIVITVVLCLPKKVNKVVSKAQAQVETMFIKNPDNKFTSFVGKLEKEEQILQANNVEKVSNDINIVMQYYCDNIIFVKDTKTFQKNYGKLNSNLDDAKSYQRKMDQIIVKVYTTIQSTSTFVQGAWKEFYGVYKDYLNSYVNVLNSMSEVYEAGLNESFKYNELSKLVNYSTNAYLSVITKNVDDKIVFVNAFDGFVNSYYKGTVISDYVLSASLQKTVANIQKFETTYKTSMANMIASLIYTESGSFKFDLKSDVLESDGIFIDTARFLLGGLKK